MGAVICRDVAVFMDGIQIYCDLFVEAWRFST